MMSESPYYSDMTAEIKGLLDERTELIESAKTPEIMDVMGAILKEAGALPVWEMDEEVRALIFGNEADNFLKHEALNVYGVVGIKAPYLEPTWFAFEEEGMDDILKKSGDSLERPLFQRLMIRPVVIPKEGADFGEERLFLARFEMPKYLCPFRYPEAKLETVTDPLGFVDWLSGMHYGCCEMLVVVGEVSSKTKDEFPTQDGEEGAVPPVPDELFDERFPEDRVGHNMMWIVPDNFEGIADGILGEPEPKEPHWWYRGNMIGDQEWPYPGEFLGLANRIFPNLPWTLAQAPGRHPFIFSGAYMDTVYITSAEVYEVIENAVGYQTLKIKWRGQDIIAYPTDFAEYQVGDRVTILKDVSTTKLTETFKDEDLWKYDEEVWRVIPFTYYNKGFGW